METLTQTVEQEPSRLQRAAQVVLHFVMGSDHTLASHGEHFVDHPESFIVTN